MTGKYYHYDTGSSITFHEDGLMEIHLPDCGIQELFFGCTGEMDIERQLYLKGNYELGSAFFC